MPTVDARQLAALLRSGTASHQPVTEVALPDGGVLRYRKDATSSVTAQIEAVPVTGAPSVLLRVFRPSASPPAEYPTAAPFLADSPVTVSESPNGLTLVWEHLADLERALADLVEQSARDGWVEDPKPAFQDFARFMGMEARTLRRASRQRVLSVTTWPTRTLSCIEGRETPAKGALTPP